MKKLEPQVCFMCLSGIFSRFWPKDFSFRQAWGNWFLCVMRNFLSNFFRFKKCFLSNCLRILSKKTFRFLRKNFAGLAIVHPIIFDQYSDVSFWRESTLIKNSSFEEKEQKIIWFYSKSPPFFWELHSVFSGHHLRFFGKKSKLLTSLRIWAKRPGISAKSLRKVFKLHSTSPGKQWERIECFKKVHTGYWAKNGRICENFKFFFLKIERYDHQFLTEKMSTGLRICNRGVRVWSRRFQTFLRKFSRRLWKLHFEEFLRMLFAKTKIFSSQRFSIIGEKPSIIW